LPITAAPIGKPFCVRFGTVVSAVWIAIHDQVMSETTPTTECS
jgi:hypothetical protein